jgi:hypothetical protein
MEKCKSCREYRNCQDSFTSWVFFIIGIIATIALRVVTLLIYIDPLYGKIAWYIGVGGFFAFFVYKYRIGEDRAKLVNKMHLVNKIHNKKELTEEDYAAISVILCSIGSKKERINYFFIFALSALALVLALYMDFLR